MADEADDKKPDPAKVFNAYSNIIETNLRGVLQGISDMLASKGLSPHDADTVILNAQGRVLCQTLTYIVLLLKMDSDPGDEVVAKTLKVVAEDFYEAIQTILSKHSGKRILHLKLDKED
jgi:hypothetical protein